MLLGVILESGDRALGGVNLSRELFLRHAFLKAQFFDQQADPQIASLLLQSVSEVRVLLLPLLYVSLEIAHGLLRAK